MIQNERFVLSCPEGYLFDVGKFVDNPLEAIRFTTFDSAAKAFSRLHKDQLKQCQIIPVKVNFPMYKGQ